MVEQVLAGHGDQIKERSIANEVFRRGADYDPGVDSIVRVKGAEVRKRLVQYYTANPPAEIRIELPSGGYVPRFAPAEETSAPPRRRWRLPLLVALACAVVVSAVLVSRLWTSGLDRLWAGMTASGAPVVIGLPSSDLYLVSGPVLAPVPPENVRRSNHYVGTGAAYGAAHVAALLARRGVGFVVKIGPDVSYEDLKHQPAVLFGGFTSPWTMEFIRKMRFQLVDSDQGIGVVDTREPGRRWLRTRPARSNALSEDYALVARIFDGDTSRPVLLLAGCAPPGTQAASEFVTSKEAFGQFTAIAPPDWPKRNFQLVLHAEVHGRVSGRPRLVAWYVW